MKSATLSVAISAAPQEVFDFVSNLQNMPLWAVNYCQGARQERGRWLVTTPFGEIETTVEANAEYGIVDFHSHSAPNVDVLTPTRVVLNGEGAEYIFTFFQDPGMSDQEFQAGQKSLHEELNLLKRLIEEKS